MKKQQPKGKIVSGLIFSPQAYLEVATGNCYCLAHNMPVRQEIERILIANKKPYGNFSLLETQKVLNHKGNYVLVDCCDVDNAGVPISEYRWFRVPEDFKE